MKFEQPLVEGVFLKRYKRFFADVKIGQNTVVAHVANTGSMKGLNDSGSLCLVSPSTNPERKMKFSLEMIKTPTSWVGVNTSLPNKLIEELWESKKVEHWKKFDSFQREVKINEQSRLDAAMWSSSLQKNIKIGKNGTAKISKIETPLHFLEVKNVTMAENGVALFPDAVTERGQKHIMEMMNLIKKGFSCELVFVIQREDCEVFRPADAIDADYGRLLREAHHKGLKISAFPCEMQAEGIYLKDKSLVIDLD